MRVFQFSNKLFVFKLKYPGSIQNNNILLKNNNNHSFFFIVSIVYIINNKAIKIRDWSEKEWVIKNNNNNKKTIPR